MKPRQEQNRCFFPRLINGEIHPHVAGILSLFRKYFPGAERGAPGRTFVFGLAHEPQLHDTEISFPCLELDFLGVASYENIRATLLSQTSSADALFAAYQDDIAAKHRRATYGKSFKTQDMWLRGQYDAWVFSAYGILKDEPEAISHEINQYCFAFIDDTKIKPGPMPAWDSFMSQFVTPEDSKIFAAFVWASLDPKNFGRQILWLYDRIAEGKTGKSSVGNAICEILKRTAVALAAEALKSHFVVSTIYGHRLVIYGDCKNDKILKYELIHSLTGNDFMQVERKFEPAFTTRMYARVMVFSNDSPDIDTYRGHEKSRLILLEMDSSKCSSRKHYDSEGNFIGSNEYEHELKDQIWHFLHFARECYQKLCPARREIIVYANMFDKAEGETEDQLENYIDDNYYITDNEDDIVLSNNIRQKYRDQFKTQNDFEVKKIRVYLCTRGCLYKRINNKRFFTHIKPKENQISIFNINSKL